MSMLGQLLNGLLTILRKFAGVSGEWLSMALIGVMKGAIKGLEKEGTQGFLGWMVIIYLIASIFGGFGKKTEKASG
jgi:hypothetical protein